MLFHAFPDAYILRDVFGKLHQDMCEYPAFTTGEMERIKRQFTLCFREETREVFGYLASGRSLRPRRLFGRWSLKAMGELLLPG